jgi:hypothetical protein
MNLYLKNQNKKVIQIGAWLRDTYAIFRLPKPKNLQKCALKGRDMNHYFPKNNYITDIQNSLVQIGCNCHCENETDCDHGHYHSGSLTKCNKYISGLLKNIEDNHNSVEIIEEISNSDYDTLLSKNIVFIYLTDASASNTVIECIVRTTPILVNPVPAVIEYLGNNYPLYYNSFEQAYDLLNDNNALLKAHKYLTKLDTTKLHIKNFMNDLTNSAMFQNI